MGILGFPDLKAEITTPEEKRKSCQDCPSCQLDSCFVSGVGHNPAHIIVVGRAPSVYSIGAGHAFQGAEGRLFQSFFQSRILNNVNYKDKGIKLFFTYAALGGRITLSAEHIKRCQPNLFRDLDRVSSPVKGRNPVLVTLGPEPLKAVGVSVRKIVEAVGKVFTTTIPTATGPKKFEVVPMLSMEHLSAQPGVAPTLTIVLAKAIDLALQGQAFQKPTAPRGYIVATTPEEVAALVQTVSEYHGPNKGAERWSIALDTETNTLYPFNHPDPRVLMLSVAWDYGKAGAIMLDHKLIQRSPEDRDRILGSLRRLLSTPKPKIFHNWKFDQKFIERVLELRVHNVAWDTLLGEHFLDEDKKGFYSLKKLTPIYAPEYQAYDDELQNMLRNENKKEEKEYSNEELLEISGAGEVPPFVDTEEARVKWIYLVKVMTEKAETKDRKIKNKKAIMKAINEQVQKTRDFLGIQEPKKTKKKKDGEYEKADLKVITEYAATDSDVTRLICQQQIQKAENARELSDAARVMNHLYLPASRTLSGMEFRGFTIDQPYLTRLEREVATKLEEIRKQLYCLVGKTLNLNGPQQVAEAMLSLNFGPLPGMDAIDSTAKGILESYTSFYPEGDIRNQFAELMIQYRECHKTIKSFLTPIRGFSQKDGRVHCDFHLNGTATGRLCISGDTVIQTDMGTWMAHQLPEGIIGTARVKTHTGKWQTIKRRYLKGKEEMFAVTADNCTIVCTKGHQLMTPIGWQSVGAIEWKNLRVSNPNGGSMAIRSIQPVGEDEVWDLEVENDHSYVAHNFIHHNSSSDPNMQNIPHITARRVKKKANGEKIVLMPGYNIKKLFVPAHEGNVIVNCDISGAELRVCTAYTKDVKMIEAINSGLDFHSYSCSLIYGIPYEEVKAKKEIDHEIAEKRKKAKVSVFCTIYGGGPGRIAQQAGCTIDEGKSLQAFLYKAFPKLHEYIINTKREVMEEKQVRTHFGRRRRFPLVGISNSHTADAIREAVNFKIQSTSSDIVLSQLIEIDEHIREIEGELLITVHDSIVLEMPERRLPDLKPFLDLYITKRIKENFDWLPVPFEYDVKVGPNYGETDEIKT